MGNQNPPLPVKITVYDHAIRAFGGEFGARVPSDCGYSQAIPGPTGRSFDVVPGMVLDTLPYSQAEKKKVPGRGASNCNSLNLENWFLPGSASGVGCREIVLQSKQDSAGRRLWWFYKRYFFPVDDIPGAQLEGPGPAWDSIPSMSVASDFDGPHNFNWCMEINAQFTYRGGETFRFRGDDDIWVYLGNRLAVDLGGIHGSEFVRNVALDTFPGIAGRIGEVFDFDLYFCERRPSGSEIEMETELELEPVRFRDLSITRPDGSLLDPRTPVQGITRLCARADYAPRDACGNQLPVPPSPFYPALWTLDGKVLARDSICIDLDPATLPLNRKVSLVAKAEGKSSRLNLQVLQPNTPSRVALTGVGRLEGLALYFRSPAESLFAPLQVNFPFAGVTRSIPVDNPAYSRISGSARIALPPTQQGPPGHSSLNGDTSGSLISQILAGHNLQFTAPLLDSIAPAVAKAAWIPSPDGGFSLDFQPSEAVTISGIPEALLFKRAGSGAPFASTFGVLGLSADGGRLRAQFPPAWNPRGVDSVSFTPRVFDGVGVAARIRFAPIVPPRWSFGSADILEWRLEQNPVRSFPWLPWSSPVSLVLLGAQGQPLNPGPDPLRVVQAGGPVLIVRSAYPLDRLEISVFSNLGAFVYSGSYTVTSQEWETLKAEAGGDTVTARILWHPASRGAKLGTGVYVLRGSVTTRTFWELDAAGAWLERRPGRRNFGPLRFGFIRG